MATNRIEEKSEFPLDQENAAQTIQNNFHRLRANRKLRNNLEEVISEKLKNNGEKNIQIEPISIEEFNENLNKNNLILKINTEYRDIELKDGSKIYIIIYAQFSIYKKIGKNLVLYKEGAIELTPYYKIIRIENDLADAGIICDLQKIVYGKYQQLQGIKNRIKMDEFLQYFNKNSKIILINNRMAMIDNYLINKLQKLLNIKAIYNDITEIPPVKGGLAEVQLNGYINKINRFEIISHYNKIIIKYNNNFFGKRIKGTIKLEKNKTTIKDQGMLNTIILNNAQLRAINTEYTNTKTVLINQYPIKFIEIVENVVKIKIQLRPGKFVKKLQTPYGVITQENIFISKFMSVLAKIFSYILQKNNSDRIKKKFKKNSCLKLVKLPMLNNRVRRVRGIH
jgi:hypothetical protein